MNRKQIALLGLLCSLALAGPASACLNHYDRPAPKPRPEGPAGFIAHLKSNTEHEEIARGPAPVDPGPDAGFKARSNYAAFLVHRGESKRAVEILERVEQEHPGEYQVAANLGTAYELSGNLDKAYHWIEQGIRRNPHSHEGTEWLHLRILKARMAVAKDPSWIKSHSVLELDFGSETEPKKPPTWPADSGGAEGVIKALAYQLRERMAFVPAPDALVGGMIADLANLLALYRTVEHALPVYELALSYHPVGEVLLIGRKLMWEESVRGRHKSEFPKEWLLFGFASLTLGGAFFLIWKRQARSAT